LQINPHAGLDVATSCLKLSLKSRKITHNNSVFLSLKIIGQRDALL